MSSNRKSVIIVGESNVGKSSLLRLLSGQTFNSGEKSTIGVTFRTVDMYHNGFKLKMAIWDASGEPRYQELVKIYCRDVSAAIVVYNVTDKQSFERTNHWINNIRENSNNIKVISLVGNKIDLRERHNERHITKKKGMDLALVKNILFFETSAKLEVNVSELFSITFKALITYTPNTMTLLKRKYKIIVLGDTGVGKTCLVERLVGRKFSINTLTTRGVHFTKVNKELNSYSIEMDIWDTFGQEKFHAIMPMFYRGAHSVILVYDITNQQTFKNLYKWVENIQKFCDENPFIILLGNKSDDEINRKVDEEEGNEFLFRNVFINRFKEISAKSDNDIEQILDEISLNLIDIFPVIPNQQTIRLDEVGQSWYKRLFKWFRC